MITDTTFSTASAPAAGTPKEESTQETPTYPYTSLLEKLETKAYQCLSQSNDTCEQDTDSPQWDLSHDALLATLLHEFTNHVVQRTHEVSTEVKRLQHSVNKVGVGVASVQNAWMNCNHNIVMEHVVVKKTNDDKSDGTDSRDKNEVQNETAEKEADSVSDDDSAAEIARLEAEEQSAIQDAMKAIPLFYDHRRVRQSSDMINDELESDNDNTFRAEEDEEAGDNFYYYPCAEADMFNSRPMPFIVGSREFMESSSAGLAVEETVQDVES